MPISVEVPLGLCLPDLAEQLAVTSESIASLFFADFDVSILLVSGILCILAPATLVDTWTDMNHSSPGSDQGICHRIAAWMVRQWPQAGRVIQIESCTGGNPTGSERSGKDWEGIWE